MNIPAFPKILHLGAKYSDHIYDGVIEITEKLDGSQWSVGRVKGDLHMRSKGAVVYPETAPAMFAGAVEWSLGIEDKLPDNFAVHGEYFQKPKHNALTYNSIPLNGFAIFAIRQFPNTFLIILSSLAIYSSIGLLKGCFTNNSQTTFAKYGLWL